MTIRRRLFVSNILMIVLPIIMSVMLANIIYMFYVNVTGIDPFRFRYSDLTFINASEAESILETHDSISSEITAYQSNNGDYIIVLPDSMNKLIEATERPNFYTPLIMLFIMSVLIVLTNFVLSKYVTKSIINSIEILSNGVREISEGNLTYRIQYKKHDEFDAVCAAFNEMAFRLSDMVNEKQKDEDNRKELIAGISHDLRTPLTSIKAYIEGLRKGVAGTPEKREKYLDTIQSKTENIEYIITQLFLFSKIDMGAFPFNFETVDIGDELNKMVSGFTDEYAGGGLTLSLKKTTQGETVSIDTVQFRNVVQNILDNAMKHGKNENIHVYITCRKENENIIITIKDNGNGVPNEMLPKLFDVFYRSDVSRNNPSNGSGLGLAISSKIIRRLHGTIAAENAMEGGLCIIISLPLVKGM